MDTDLSQFFKRTNYLCRQLENGTSYFIETGVMPRHKDPQVDRSLKRIATNNPYKDAKPNGKLYYWADKMDWVDPSIPQPDRHNSVM
jgi:hypothetical protein